MNKDFLVAVIVCLGIFAGYQQFLLKSYENINARLQAALSECIGLEK